jgi:uncharacterized membrane protein YkvA (DUF1232 family)
MTDMTEEMEKNISEEKARSALADKEKEAEELLKDAEKTHAFLYKAEKPLAQLKKIPVIGGLVDDITTTIELIGDCVKGNYREIPASIIVSSLGAILYLVSPFDLIPDFIPIGGFLDDALVLTLVLGAGLALELRKYRRWKAEYLCLNGNSAETTGNEELPSSDDADEETDVAAAVESEDLLVAADIQQA